MSKNKVEKNKELNNKNEETKNLFASLKQYKKKSEENIDKNTSTDNSIVNDINENEADNKNNDTNNGTSENNDVNNSDNIYMSLLKGNNKKEEYVGATHYFRKDQLKDLDKFSKKTNKLKNEFMRELIDLVFAELIRGLEDNKQNAIAANENNVKDNIINNSNSESNTTVVSDSPFGSLLEVNDSRDQYVRATHYFRQDQLKDLDKFVDKSGKSKNEFVRDAVDLVFSQLKEVNN